MVYCNLKYLPILGILVFMNNFNIMLSVLRMIFFYNHGDRFDFETLENKCMKYVIKFRNCMHKNVKLYLEKLYFINDVAFFCNF